MVYIYINMKVNKTEDDYVQQAIDYILQKKANAVKLTDTSKCANFKHSDDVKIRSFRMQKQFGARKFIKP